jgi:hypothetical protein
LQSIRLEALVKLDHSDRIIIVHMIRKCANGRQIVETPELNAAVLRRRLDRLESVPPVSSTEDKWNTIHVRALEVMSEEDLRIFQEIEALRKCTSEDRANPSAVRRDRAVEEATMTAVSDANVRFTMSELNHLLAAE